MNADGESAKIWQRLFQRRSSSADQRSSQLELKGNRHPDCDGIATAARGFKAPTLQRFDGSLVQCWMTSGGFDLHFIHPPVLSNPGFEQDGPFRSLSPGSIGVSGFDLIATPRPGRTVHTFSRSFTA